MGDLEGSYQVIYYPPARSLVMCPFLLFMIENQYKSLQSEAEVCQMKTVYKTN